MDEGAIELSKNKYEIDMCNGTIMDKLVSFAIPLMVSGILQLMFNAVDIIVVGRFSGSQALAAVGSTTALINVFTNLFIGVSLGANVLAARFYAAGKTKEMSETVHTSVTLALISGVAMAAVGLVFSRWALEVMGTPADVIDQSTLYMRIYFLGMPFFMLYNYGAAILRAVGDSQTSADVPGCGRCDQRGAEYDSGDRVSSGCCRCCHCDHYFPADFLYSGSSLSVYDGQQLSAPVFQIVHEEILSGTDFPGGNTGRSAEYGY